MSGGQEIETFLLCITFNRKVKKKQNLLRFAFLYFALVKKILIQAKYYVGLGFLWLGE